MDRRGRPGKLVSASANRTAQTTGKFRKRIYPILEKQMNDFQTLMQELKQLRERVDRLESEKSLASSEFQKLPPNSIVGKEYVAWRFGISVRAVERGEHGTDKLRISKKGEKLRFRKDTVDRHWQKISQPVAEKVASLRSSVRSVRR